MTQGFFKIFATYLTNKHVLFRKMFLPSVVKKYPLPIIGLHLSIALSSARPSNLTSAIHIRLLFGYGTQTFIFPGTRKGSGLAFCPPQFNRRFQA
jgi:hypothetical protein